MRGLSFPTLPVLAVAAVFARGATAHAEATGRLALVRGDGAEHCPDVAQLRTAVNTVVGRSVIADDGIVSVEVLIAAGPSSMGVGSPRWSALVFVRDLNGLLIGRRDLTSSEPACASLMHAVAFAVGVALDADAALRPRDGASPSPSPSDAPTASSSPAPILSSSSPSPAPRSDAVSTAPASSSPPPTVSQPVQSPRFTSAFGLRFAGQIGLQPSVSPGGGLVLDLLWNGIGLRGVLWYWPEVRTAPSSTSTSIGVRLETGSLAVCPLFVHAALFRFEACAGVGGGVVTGAGHGYTHNAIVDAPYFAVEAGVAVRRPFGPLFFEAGVDATVPIPHYNVTVTNLGTVWPLEVVNGRAFLGAGIVLP